MAITITSDSDDQIELREFFEYVNGTFKSITLDSLVEMAPYFRRLGNNRKFLASLIADELKAITTFQENNPYSSQSLNLGLVSSKFYLRANVWLPKERLHEINAKGESQLFSYNLPHDHNFDFLTIGYFGPGYRTEIYEYDTSGVVGEIGEQVEIRFLEKTTLPQGKLMIYRASADIHVQHFPEAFSISLNVLAPARQPIRDQFVFDLERGKISGVLRSTFSGQKLLIEAAAALCDGNIDDVLESISISHQSNRTREVARKAIETRQMRL
jgi:hypothetical protein